MSKVSDEILDLNMWINIEFDAYKDDIFGFWLKKETRAGVRLLIALEKLMRYTKSMHQLIEDEIMK